MAQTSRLVDINASLPSRVFVDRRWHCSFHSFDPCFGPDLFDSCALLSEAVGDDRVHFVMLGPDPVEYYFREFSRFGALSIPRTEDTDSVWSVFDEDPGGSPADA